MWRTCCASPSEIRDCKRPFSLTVVKIAKNRYKREQFHAGGFVKLAIAIRKAKRINDLPPYLFAEIDRRKRAALARGVDLIDLGIGDPDIPTPSNSSKNSWNAAASRRITATPIARECQSFARRLPTGIKRRFNVRLDAATEVVSLIGSKEGIGNMAVAFVDPGDVVLVSSPCYPVYHIGTAFNGGKNYFLPLKKENHFLPDLDSIPADVAKQAKLLWINYPNNPTAAVADKRFLSTSDRLSPLATTSSSATTAPIRKWVMTAIGR